ncbi:unnamed protein product [Bursaphelenchus xylophilus]|uniref:(pine wood nematode) hypothetical protein n=1 Tax=Bursaphelenchus xylophilus TaxID=6326 RepID=A0A1I7RTW9_BURXY|nr:unnamed protein product [Bursaphelenchus xylophilus]CAG9132131.1 unnamed protein product [Bursaphelenchus xylophilus]
MVSLDGTSSQDLEQYEYDDCTVSVKLLCTQVGGVRRVKDGIPISNCRFQTGDGKSLQICGWRSLAETVAGTFKPDHFYKIGPVTKSSSKRYGDLTLGFELTVHEATQIQDLGTLIDDEAGTFVPLAESYQVEGKVVTRGFIQSLPFNFKGTLNFSIVFGLHRVPVKCPMIEFDSPLERGDMVEISGRYNGRNFMADTVTPLAEEPLADGDPQLESVRPPPRRTA